jgi:hypothetical protein
MRKSGIAAALAAAGLVAAGIAAPAGAAPSSKGTTTVTFKAETVALLTEGLGFTGIAPTGAGSASFEEDGDLAAVFGITGRTGDLKIQHVGGLALSKGDTTATLSNFTINVDSGFVSGIVNDSFRTDLFQLGGATADGLALIVTPDAGALLADVFDIPNVAGVTLAYGAPNEIVKSKKK